MARREPVSISLFPFMSILACTIGALTFLLITMAVTSVGATRLIGDFDAESQAEAEAERERIEKRNAEAKAERLELERAAERMEALDRILAAKGFTPGVSLDLIEETLTAREEATRAKRRIATIEAELKRVRTDKGTVEASIDVLNRRRETLPILIDPTDLARDQRAYFIECEAEGVTAYRVRDDFEYFVSANSLESSRDLRRYLNRLKSEPGALLILLIRKKGIATSRTMKRLADEVNVRVASLPLPGDGELDFRLLRLAEGEG